MRKILSGLSVLLAGVAFAPMALAQAPASAAAAQDAKGNGIEEVVVTAEHRTETAQSAPIAITVLSPEVLRTTTNPADISKAVPAAQFGNAGGSNPLLYIRGVGTFSSNPYTDSAVAVNYDGVYVGRPIATSGFFYDLDRIEVLKGPQGTLYGRNATGGALNIIPVEPSLDSNSADIIAQGGNYSSYSVQGDANLVLSDDAALRISGTAYHHGGYQSDGTDSEGGQGARAQLLWNPNSWLSNRVDVDYFHAIGTGNVGSIVAYTNPATFQYTPTHFGTNVGMYDPRSVALLNSVAYSQTAGIPIGPLLAKPGTDNDYWGVTDTVNADFGWSNLAVIAGYRGTRVNELYQPSDFVIDETDNDHQFTAEARLAGTSGAFDWLGGVYFFDENVKSGFHIGYSVLASEQDLAQKTRSFATFGNVTWHVTDSFRLTGAVRRTQDHKTFNGNAYSVTELCTQPTHFCPQARYFPGIPNNIPAQLASIGFIQPISASPYIDTVTPASGVIWLPNNVPVSGTEGPSRFTYRAAAEYDVAPENMLYASYETGFRAGGFSFSSVVPKYKPETIGAWTVGSKNRFLDDHLQLNLEAFYWTYSNQQVSHEAFGKFNDPEFPTENIGSSTNKGVEADIVAKPWDDTLLSADLQYLDATNDKFIYNAPDSSGLAGLPPGSLPPTTACPFTFNSATDGYAVNCSGKRALYSPSWTINLGAQQTVHFSDDLKLLFEVDTHYQTSQIIMFERLPGSTQAAYWLVDAGITLARNSDNWSLGAYIQNIGNERPKQNSYIDTLAGLTTALYGPPRTYGLRLEVHL